MPSRPLFFSRILAAAVICGIPATTRASSVARDWNEELLAAIRINLPNPPSHARNLFHTAAAMYNAWAAYSPTATGYINNEKVSPLPMDVEAARREAVSYAAYRVIRARFATGQGSAVTLARLDAKLNALGYSTSIGQGALSSGATPAELGKRAGEAILTWATVIPATPGVPGSPGDGFTNTTYPQPYNAAFNPNVNRSMSVMGTNLSDVSEMQLGNGVPELTDPNLWQPLAFVTSLSQNGIPVARGPQQYVGLSGMATVPFSLQRTDPLKPWLDPSGPPSRLSRPGDPSASDAEYKAGALSVIEAGIQLNDDTIINISPASTGNNPLGSDSGGGRAINPVTGLAYAPNPAKRSDFTRVLAEFWADGPSSETPPGHWHVLANQVVDAPGFSKRLRGTGPVVNDLAWDVIMYFTLSAATHDAACAAWALKRYYSGPRPITMIRYMAVKGQSSDPLQPSYHTEGLPLKSGAVEVITAASAAPGGPHEQIWSVAYGTYRPGTEYTGAIAVRGWPGDHPSNGTVPAIATNKNDVRWMLGMDWLPFQRKTFNTPAFPGYVSGHSTFSRAAAEALTALTGTPYFPGGLGEYIYAANSMQIDLGPSAPVKLQWGTYYDAADQAGQSRRWGGIHVPEDDYDGRVIGSLAGLSAFSLAEKYWSGTINNDMPVATLTRTPQGVVISWTAIRGMYHKVQTSTDLNSWTDVTAYTLAYDVRGTWTDTAPVTGNKFYRIKRP